MSQAYAGAMSEIILVPADRCDRCPARAVHRVQLPGGGTLDFCAHHWNDHRDALEHTEAIVLV